jgi:hypothetical protein
MRLEEPTGRRAEVAYEQLSAGNYINFRGLGLQIVPSGVVECRVFSQWAPENLNAEIAAQEFAVGKEQLGDLLAGSEKFASLLEPRVQIWELLYDYGQGAIRLCRLDGDKLVWDAGWPKRGPAA